MNSSLLFPPPSCEYIVKIYQMLAMFKYIKDFNSRIQRKIKNMKINLETNFFTRCFLYPKKKTQFFWLKNIKILN